MTVSQYSIGFLLGCSLLFGSGCSVDLPKDHYSKQMPRVTRGYHLVREGDTLFQIAWRYGWDYKELARANDLDRPYVLYPNQKIMLYLSPPSVPKSSGSGRSSSSGKHTGAPKKTERASGGKQYKTASYSWAWPLKGKVLSGFKRNDPLHQGLKISTPIGSKVKAAASGTVVYVGSGIRGLEKLIIVEHPGGFLSAYAHNRKILKKEAEIVKVGEVIAETGNNGSGESILYFEIRHKGVSVDPSKYLR
ncbi:MAG: peptidoglycan DD-metalloendopeptidase family protein [Pseudomonadales bacterium]|nr:peptidoglycan DD-metalloendopeptidase family protein [Pseudomonadales bacterium]